MQIPFTHDVQYLIDERPDAEDVASSILANKYLLQESAKLFEDFFEGLSVELVKVHVASVSQQSPLRESFLVALLVVYQGDLEKAVPKVVADLTGLTIPEEHATLLTVGSCLVAFYAVDWAYRKISNGAESVRIKNVLDGLVKDISEKHGLPEQRVREALDKKYTGRKRLHLARKALHWFRPAKIMAGGIVVAGSVAVDAATVQDVPLNASLDAQQPEEISDPYENVEISIVAQDKRSIKQGWAGTIEKISDDPIKLRLFPPITPDQAFMKPAVRGDGILVSRLQVDGSYKPHTFHLVRLR
ncbi:MAG TPA: hypothetical protein VGN75_14150 [Kaistia sp.]|jgi:hypothetical protein|nr:hypothetical protein [Kaistia sp.]